MFHNVLMYFFSLDEIDNSSYTVCIMTNYMFALWCRQPGRLGEGNDCKHD